ncbi:hypothetical protein H5410_052515 [Solanum commersonii]|uniref:Photosystem I P700 chlorophyll a apoprotein A1 n=1 Tax=Solanum commersonii TaxID=4109 RepID=A0A9J5X4B6_SOLCO|nr:hypothetical protein H5410_052515 [Solanum commersonii]
MVHNLSLFTHHMWIGGFLIVGAAACGHFMVRDYDLTTRYNDLLDRVLRHRDAIISHLNWACIFLGFHSFGLYIHNDTMSALGRPQDMFSDTTIQLQPAFAQWIQNTHALALVALLPIPLGTADFLVHHIHAFTIHVTVLILLKGVLFARSSRLIPDKANLGFRFPCDGHGRGGTCQVSPGSCLLRTIRMGSNSYHGRKLCAEVLLLLMGGSAISYGHSASKDNGCEDLKSIMALRFPRFSQGLAQTPLLAVFGLVLLPHYMTSRVMMILSRTPLSLAREILSRGYSDPLHVRPIAHAIWDPHFGQPPWKLLLEGALAQRNIAIRCLLVVRVGYTYNQMETGISRFKNVESRLNHHLSTLLREVPWLGRGSTLGNNFLDVLPHPQGLGPLFGQWNLYAQNPIQVVIYLCTPAEEAEACHSNFLGGFHP